MSKDDEQHIPNLDGEVDQPPVVVPPPVPPIVLQRVNRDAWILLSNADLAARRRRHQHDPRRRGQPFPSFWGPKDPMSLLGQLVKKNIGEECMLCLEDMTLVSVPWELPCGHVFHRSCLEKLKKGGEFAPVRDRCPYCRADSYGYAPPTPSCKVKDTFSLKMKGGKQGLFIKGCSWIGVKHQLWYT